MLYPCDEMNTRETIHPHDRLIMTDTTIDNINHPALTGVHRITHETKNTKENLLTVNDQEMPTMMTVVVISKIQEKKDFTIEEVARLLMRGIIEITLLHVATIVVVLMMKGIDTITLRLRDILPHNNSKTTGVTEMMIHIQVRNREMHHSVIATTNNNSKIIQPQMITIG